ncbi:hypothetical protein M2155_000574 [Streptomyces sp. SAI-119]|uniref:hypothetical protein n=1 Tax=Streptomyces sp. SAI-119 TaxID=2940541 RepID=UPI002473AA53|nr:hypothetical protein [Streptomyces sp. SAI-119]MDH6448166.1 hypothetical protein [Streptomyces sp. SAI-119]
MTGPEHYRRGESLLARCNEFSEGERRTSLATEASAHFLAALAASHAASAHPQSTSWDHAINGQEQP